MFDDDVKGLELYDALTLEGKDLDVRPGCPNLIERIEGGLFVLWKRYGYERYTFRMWFGCLCIF